ncbi:MAG: hypothetical protein WCK84_06520 [Bacteroidota bacterium]
MQNRRQFFDTLVRVGIFASLTLVSGALISRWTGADKCSQGHACGNCNLSNRCQLPEADEHRLEKARSTKTNAEDGRTGK